MLQHNYPGLCKPISLALGMIFPLACLADEIDEERYTAILPTIEVQTSADTSKTKGYIGYDEASVTRNGLPTKEIPQTVDIINIQKNKNYGTNDLSSILEGNAGIDATYDMRGESIYLRGFQADASDIYRDGIRESGQVRRSTANIERVEILKGPASILYGRSGGGGVINLVSKYANFKTSRSIGLGYGSWASRSIFLDLNQVVNQNIAMRLVGEYTDANAWRSGVKSRNRMFSPSVVYRSDDGRISWLGQYTYDDAWRVPDRNPTKMVYDQMGIDYRKGFSRVGDYVEDNLRVWRSELTYHLNHRWQLNWQLAHRRADQDFDHYYNGSFDRNTQLLNQVYYWQKTSNVTFTHNINLVGEFDTGSLKHHLTVGVDFSREKRQPMLAGGRSGFDNEIDPYADRASWTRLSSLPAVTTYNTHKGKSFDLFAQDLIGFSPKWKVLIGGRLSYYRFSSDNHINGKSASYRGHSFSPNVGVVYDLTPSHTAYISYSKSFAPYGGRSYLSVGTDSPDTFDAKPQNSLQWEVGLKSDWLNQRLSTTLAVYQLEKRNIRYRPDRNDPTYWAMRGKERSRGVELGAIGQIWRNWYIRSSLGWMSAKIVEDKQFPQLVGVHLGNTSNFSGNLFVRYAPNDRLYGELGVTKVGKRYGAISTSRGVSIGESLPGFTRVDAMIGWNQAPFNVTLAVANVFNKRYWRSDSMPANPRSVTMRLNYTF